MLYHIFYVVVLTRKAVTSKIEEVSLSCCLLAKMLAEVLEDLSLKLVLVVRVMLCTYACLLRATFPLITVLVNMVLVA